MIGAPDALEPAESVPHVAPEQPAPVSVQTTPAFCASFATVAVNCRVPEGAWIVAVPGETLTAMGGDAVTVRPVDPLTPASVA